jgi:guanine deaminase
MISDRDAAQVHRSKEIWYAKKNGHAIELVSIQDGAMVVNGAGKIIGIGRANEFKSKHQVEHIVDHGSAIIMPGFVDAHLHCPQLDVMGSGGLPLLDWLHQYVFPAEAKFSDLNVALAGTKRFIRELKSNGITSAAVFSSVHAVAADILFQEFDREGLRLVTGKTSMDVGAPATVLQSVQTDIADQEQLIAKWHGKSGRLFYALTPRFALSCSREMMRALGDLRERHPTCYVQTHVSETVDEVNAVRSIWKDTKDYLGVYEDHGLIGEKTILAHGIHLTDHEWERIALKKASVVHCPTSNTFLGSGLFSMDRARDVHANVCLASDIGAGTSISPWQTMLECYKVQSLQGRRPSAAELLYMSTLAGAEALGLSATCGSLDVGKDADFIVIDPSQRQILAERIAAAETPSERIFACMTHGDDRIIAKTYVSGQKVNARDAGVS